MAILSCPIFSKLNPILINLYLGDSQKKNIYIIKKLTLSFINFFNLLLSVLSLNKKRWFIMLSTVKTKWFYIFGWLEPQILNHPFQNCI